jgi:hypothetical protein
LRSNERTGYALSPERKDIGKRNINDTKGSITVAFATFLTKTLLIVENLGLCLVPLLLLIDIFLDVRL